MFFIKKLDEFDFTKYNLKKDEIIPKSFDDYEGEIFLELLNLSQSKIVSELGEKYFKLGVNSFCSLTYNTNRSFLKSNKIEDFLYDLNYNAVKIVRDIVDKYNIIDKNYKRNLISAISLEHKVPVIDVVEQVKIFLTLKPNFIYLFNINDKDYLLNILIELENLMSKRNKDLPLLLCSDSEPVLNFQINELSFVKILGKGLSISLQSISFKDSYNYNLLSLKLNNNNYDTDQLYSFRDFVLSNNIQFLDFSEGITLSNISDFLRFFL